MGRRSDAKVSQKLCRVNGSIAFLGLSQVEHSLELSVVCVVILVAVGKQIEVAASLICLKKNVLSAPKSSLRALLSPSHAPSRQRPKTPPT